MKIFYATRQANSDAFVLYILSTYFVRTEKTIKRNKNGKPYLENVTDCFFSVSHSATHTFVAVNKTPVGLDVEPYNRKIKYAPILKKFSLCEQESVHNSQDFLRLWTLKESVIKYLGGSIAFDLDKIEYANERVYYAQQPLPVFVQTTECENHILTVCSENNSQKLQCIYLNNPSIL